jgi:peptidylprolyl isomerase
VDIGGPRRVIVDKRTPRRSGPIVLAVVGGLLAVAVVVGLAVVLVLHRHDSTSAAAGSSSSAVAVDPALASKPVVVAGAGELTKLVVTTVIQGSGPAVAQGQTLTVNYVGVSFKTGVEFDSSWQRHEPFTFRLGPDVIQGWAQGLSGVRVGSRVQLDIPGSLAYGDVDQGSGSPTGALRFVVDVLSAA